MSTSENNGSFRARDHEVEKEISSFMDEKYYKCNVTEFHRFERKEDQLEGKDVTFSVGNLKNIIVDEKAQTHYINKDLPTFAFELDFLRGSGTLTPGWLLDDGKKTEYYMLIWPFAKKTWNIRKDDIIRLSCMLVCRRKITDYLESEGFTETKLKEISEQIRKDDIEGPIGKDAHPHIYFYSTKRLVERPVNIIIRREELKELAELIFEVCA